jgi:predicted TIM-barrel fold metal-dependent hydrolase
MPKSPDQNVRAIRALGLDADALDRVLFRNAARLLRVSVE